MILLLLNSFNQWTRLGTGIHPHATVLMVKIVLLFIFGTNSAKKSHISGIPLILDGPTIYRAHIRGCSNASNKVHDFIWFDVTPSMKSWSFTTSLSTDWLPFYIIQMFVLLEYHLQIRPSRYWTRTGFPYKRPNKCKISNISAKCKCAKNFPLICNMQT